jgi:drug/metabolite transporter (DMT)-like permease
VHSYKGVLLILVSCFFYAGASILIKVLPSGIDGYFVSCVRFIIGLILSLAALRVSRLPLKIHDPFPWVMRGILGSASMIAVYIAIRMTSSGRAILLADTYPVFVVLFGTLFFAQKAKLMNIVPLCICVCGVILVFFDSTRYPLSGNLLGLCSGVLGGAAVHYIRICGRRNNSYIVYLSACLFGAAATSFSLLHVPVLSAGSWSIVVGVGILAFAGQIAMTTGYRYISAAGGSITGLAEVPLTVCAGFIFLNEQITEKFLLGAAVIVSGLAVNFYAVRNEGRTKPSVLYFQKDRGQ